MKHKSRYIFMITLALFMGQAQSKAQIIAHWSFDNHSRDLRNNHHAQIFRVSFTEDAMLGSHALTTGPKDTSRCVWAGNFDPSSGDFTLSMWISPHPENHGDQILIAKRSAWKEESVRWQFLLRAPRKPHQLQHGNKDVLRFETTKTRTEIEYKFEPGSWNHVALVYQADRQQATFFVNGEQEGSPQKISLGSPLDAPMVIGGGHPDDWWEIFHGRIDDACIWGEALQPGYIRAIHQLGNDPDLGWDAGMLQTLFDLYREKNPDWKVLIGEYAWSFADLVKGKAGGITMEGSNYLLPLDDRTNTGVIGKLIEE